MPYATFILLCESFQRCLFQPVNCVVTGKIKSLHITVRKLKVRFPWPTTT